MNALSRSPIKNDNALISNIDGTADVACTLYLTSQLGSDITSTTVVAAETEPASSSSVTLTVKTVSATTDVFADERVYKSDGTLFGTCTARNSNTEIVFAGGLESQITNNDVLHTGTRYILFDQITVPAKSTLKLEQDEISFNNAKYDLYCKSGDSDGQLVFTFIY